MVAVLDRYCDCKILLHLELNAMCMIIADLACLAHLQDKAFLSLDSLYWNLLERKTLDFSNMEVRRFPKMGIPPNHPSQWCFPL